MRRREVRDRQADMRESIGRREEGKRLGRLINRRKLGENRVVETDIRTQV